MAVRRRPRKTRGGRSRLSTGGPHAAASRTFPAPLPSLLPTRNRRATALTGPPGHPTVAGSCAPRRANCRRVVKIADLNGFYVQYLRASEEAFHMPTDLLSCLVVIAAYTPPD